MFVIGAIVSLCYVPGITGALIATQWPVLSILLPFTLWRNGPMTAVHWVGLIFVAYAAASLRYVPLFNDGVYGLWSVCLMALSFWFGTTLPDLRKLYAGLATGASVSSLFAVMQAFGYPIVPYISTNPGGLYVSSIVQAMLVVFLILGLLSERMWLWAPLLIPGLLVAHSRGAWFALATGLIGLYTRRKIVAILFLVPAAYLFLKPLSSSDDLRVFIWQSAYEKLSWFGYGSGSFISWLLTYKGYNLYPEYAHNDFLQLAFEYGIFAAIPFGIFALAFTRTKSREWPVFVAFITAACYSMPLFAPVVSFLVCVVAGRLVRDWAVVRGHSFNRGLDVLARQRNANQASQRLIPVVTTYQAKG